MTTPQLSLHSRLEVDGELCTVTALGLTGIEPIVTLKPDTGEFRDAPLLEVIRLFRAFHECDQPRTPEAGDILDDLPERSRLIALERARHVREIVFGDPTGVWQPLSRRSYDPTRTTRAKRVALKAAELAGARGYSRASLYRYIADFEAGGVRALAPHQPAGPRFDDPRVGLDDEALNIIYAVLGELARDKSTISLGKRVVRAKVGLDDHHIDDPLLTPHRLTRVVRLVSKELGLPHTARSRRSTQSRAQRGHRRPPPSMPGERIEIDSTQLNVNALCPRTGRTFRPWLSVAVCVATRLMTVRLSPDRPSGRDVRLLLFDLMTPLVLPEITRPHTWVLGVPDEVFIKPAFGVGTIVVDHGKEYENHRVVDLLARWGATIEFARTRTGSDKPYVESANRIWDLMQQDLEGYVGNAPENRGDSIDAVYTLSGLSNVLNEWAITWYPHRPHSGLPSATVPGNFLTPSQKYRQCFARGGDLHVTPHPDDIFGFLDTQEAAVSSDGVHLHNFRYDGPILNTVRQGSLSPLSRPGNKRRFYFDPYDRSRLFFRDDTDGRWHVLHAIHHDGTTFPPFSDIVAEDFAASVGRAPLTENEKQNAESEFFRFARKLAAEDRDRWSRDRARVEMAVQNPESTPDTTDTASIDVPPEPPFRIDDFAIWENEPDPSADVW